MSRSGGHATARGRLTQPWRHKAPALMSVVYFFLGVVPVTLSDALLATVSALSTIAGIAGLGYLSNDLADRRADRRAGKPNATVDLPGIATVTLVVLFVAIALWPWVIFVPVDRIWTTLLAAEFCLFAAYSIRPFRLKERGVLGPLTDALYAHANPALLAAYTLFIVTGRAYSRPVWLLGSLWCWQFLLGVRNILQHQIADADADRASGTATYVTRIGESTARDLLSRLVVPAELAAFAAWLAVASMQVPALAIACALHVAATALAIHQSSGRPLAGSLEDRLALFVDAFCLAWMPVVFLLALVALDWRMIALLAIHLAVFGRQLAPTYAMSFRALRGMCATALAFTRREAQTFE